jgi:hypothetical protein
MVSPCVGILWPRAAQAHGVRTGLNPQQIQRMLTVISGAARGHSTPKQLSCRPSGDLLRETSNLGEQCLHHLLIRSDGRIARSRISTCIPSVTLANTSCTTVISCFGEVGCFVRCGARPESSLVVSRRCSRIAHNANNKERFGGHV